MTKYYAGIGSRETPQDIQDKMGEISLRLSKQNYILRSGNAHGADQAFAYKAAQAEIWLPWRSFNKADQLVLSHHTYKVISEKDKEAFDSSSFHPVGFNLPETVKKLMARNYRQLIGFDGAPNSEFVVCWTKDGKDTGGTGQALRIATHHNIPIYNLFLENVYEELVKSIF